MGRESVSGRGGRVTECPETSKANFFFIIIFIFFALCANLAVTCNQESCSR